MTPGNFGTASTFVSASVHKTTRGGIPEMEKLKETFQNLAKWAGDWGHPIPCNVFSVSHHFAHKTNTTVIDFRVNVFFSVPLQGP